MGNWCWPFEMRTIVVATVSRSNIAAQRWQEGQFCWQVLRSGELFKQMLFACRFRDDREGRNSFSPSAIIFFFES